jgi:hypothetical protein
MENINQNTNNKGVFPGVNLPPVNNANVESKVLDSQKPITQVNVSNETRQNQAVPSTYVRLETKNSEGQLLGVLEIDLISFRERGVESRYLSVNTVGVGQDGNQSETIISIDNEDDFNKFKNFVSNLNWND